MSIAYKVRPIGGEVLLPAGYRRCEYLESTGTQYIDTGVKLSSESEVRCEYEFIKEIEGINQYLFDAQMRIDGAFTQFGFTLYNYLSPSRVYAYVRTSTAPQLATQRPEGKTSITLNKKGLIINNVFLQGTEPDEFILPINCYLFADNFFGNVSSRAYVRVYSFSISRNNQLQLNYIPCLDDKGKPCMFDTVSRTPYYNKGTSDFLYKLKTPLIRKLPRGFQPLEYLESTGTQYIDTGVNLSNESELSLDCYLIDSFTNQFLFGARNFYGSAANAITFNISGAAFSVFPQFGDYIGPIPVKEEWLESRLFIRNSKNGLFINGERVAPNSDTQFFETPVPAALFSIMEAKGIDSRKATARIYSAKISTQTTIVRDFIPCLDDKGKPCMWDYVTRRPFYNQDTTGPDFLYG